MNASAPFLSPAEAATTLGVSPKALRLYEQRGLVRPMRSEAGWRTYGPEQMVRAADVVTLRALGLSLTQIVRVLDGDAAELGPALAAHQANVEAQVRALSATVGKLRDIRAALAEGRAPRLGELLQLVAGDPPPAVCFELPWPWGGERFDFPGPATITFVVGPLGSGKTQLAKRLAAELPGATSIAPSPRNRRMTLRSRHASMRRCTGSSMTAPPGRRR